MKEVHLYLPSSNKYEYGMEIANDSVIRACVLCGNLYHIPWDLSVRVDCVCDSLKCQSRLNERGVVIQPSVRKRLVRMFNG